MKQRYLKLCLLTLLAAFCCAPATSASVKIGDLYYNLDEAGKTAVVTYESYDSNSSYVSGDLVIPSTVNYNDSTYSVTSIGESAFSNCSGLTSVTIPNSVTSIGEFAFLACEYLASVTIPNSVTSIGGMAFRMCYRLTSVTIPNSVISISEYAFWECRSMTSVTIGNSVTSIGSGAFRECDDLNSVHITDIAAWCKIGFSNVESNPLYDAHNLYLNGSIVKDLVIPDSVTSIGSYAFYNCSGLTSVTIPDSVTSIGNHAFEDCSGLTSVHITDIAAWCKIKFSGGRYSNPLYYAHKLYLNGKEVKNLVIPNSVTSISDYAFDECSCLTSVTIGSSVTSIGSSAFHNCSGLTSVHITDIAAWCKMEFGTNDNNPLYYAHRLYLNGSIVKNLVIPNSVTSISDYAFYGCTCLKSVTIPDSVTSIGNSAFHDCSGLTSVTIGSSVTSIGSDAFYNCSGLTSVTIGSLVTSIGNAFSNASVKKAIWLTNTPPEGASNISAAINYVPNDQYSFSNQKVYPSLNLKFEVDNVVYVPVSPSERTCDVIDCNYSPTSKTVTIDSVVANRSVSFKVLNINPYAFYGNDSFTALTVKNNGDIGESAFSDCNSLRTATISNNGVIGESAFSGCNPLQTATISNNGDIGESAFSGCNSLQTATIGNNGVIGNSAFSGCYMGKSLTIGDNVTAIGDNAFYNNKGLRGVVIPDSVTTVGRSAFAGCSLLNSVTIGKGVNVLSSSLFKNCSSLGNILIPGNVNEINDSVFADCWTLQDVTFADASGDETPTITLGSNGSSPLFAGCPLDEVYIGRKLSYKASSSYGYSPFYRNMSLKAVKITDKETEIYDNEFYGCLALQSFECGDGVTKIGKWAFSGCSALQSFASGAGVESIGEEAFSDCTELTAFATLATVPPVCGDWALDGINKLECTLYVLPESVDYYKAADQWKEFFFIDTPSGIDEIETEGIGGDTECGETVIKGYYNTYGVRADKPWDGLNIVVYSDGTRRKMVK